MTDVVMVSIDADAAGRMIAQVEDRMKRFNDMRPLGLAIARVLRASFAKNIDSGGRPKYAPLSPNTLASKKLKGYPSTPLIGSRLLRNALARMNVRGNVTYITADGVIKVGVNLPYAKYLRQGTKPYTILPKTKKALAFQMAGGKVVVRKVNHPGLKARDFMVVQQEDWDAIRSLMRQFGSGKPLPQEATDS